MPARSQLSFATCNLLNLNLPGRAIYSDKDGWTPQLYKKKVAWTAQKLGEVQADVWGFQEVWHPEALQEAFALFDGQGTYELLMPKDHQGNSIVCAAAVRKDFLVGEYQWITNFPEKFQLASQGDDAQTPEISVGIHSFSRPVLRFHIRPREHGEIISVYVAHLKSKGPTKVYLEEWYKQDQEYFSRHSLALGAALSTIRRTSEAAALRIILTEEMKKTTTPVVVLGDFNDGQHSNTLNILTEQPNYLLNGLDKGGADNGLYTTGTLQEYRSLQDVYYTHVFKNTQESLDHILVSQEFYDHSRGRIWAFKGMEVWNDHLNQNNHKETGTSDHGIVKAMFEYRPFKNS
ncbi:MAG: endonuclease/exonuclease/phosphatase family protein [Nitrospira sp.]|nr:endonuclease/exonuclease/phosphatase family protein [Nitrospira sp.]